MARLESLSFGERSWGAHSLKESFVTPGVTVILGGKAPSAPLGFAIWRDLGDEAEILSLGVAPPVRRGGLGAVLLKTVIERTRKLGAGMVFLEVDSGNIAALSLYRNVGFKDAGVRRRYYRNGADAAVMRLIL